MLLVESLENASVSSSAELYGESLSLGVMFTTACIALFLMLAASYASEMYGIAYTTWKFYSAMWYFLPGGSLSGCPANLLENERQSCHLYSLALMFYIWDKQHYRNGTFQKDMIKNLRNVALPGTGLPLSFVAKSKIATYAFILFINPFVCFIASYVGSRNMAEWDKMYKEFLLQPRDWFSFWRLNCRLATFHSYVTDDDGYSFEDKLSFLQKAQEVNVPVTPCLDTPWIVCKHRNEEGGLGYMDFVNASSGGDWIIQPRIHNDDFISSMLPENAPLSTFRVISASRCSLRELEGESGSVGDVEALSCVWRAGRANASTDHSCIMFDVDPETGVLKKGTTSKHWYQLGPMACVKTPWSSTHDITKHPDTGKLITGTRVENMQEMMDLVREAHFKIMPGVPLCGWDVAFTREYGAVLLEVNISCNFFRGTFDERSYFKFMTEYLKSLEKAETLRLLKLQ